MEMFRISINIILFIIVIHVITCFKINKSVWSKCPKSDGKIRTFFDISFNDCAKECLNRPLCKALGQRRYINVCELYKTEETEEDKTCVTVRKKDIAVEQGEIPCSCKDGETCDTATKKCVHRECDAFTNLDHGIVLGNMFQIGARLKVECDPGWAEKSRQSIMTCLQNGSWSFTPSCVDIDECESNPCKNGGTCNNLQNKYTCTCAGGWTGTNCDQDINECESNPCKNGATCINQQNKYTCTCPGGWKGTNCDQDIDECANNPCKNGTCENQQNKYTCTCSVNWRGTNCDKEARCPDKFMLYKEKCYYFSSETKLYSEAEDTCHSVYSNSYLVEIDSEEENDYLTMKAKEHSKHDLTDKEGFYLIGLNDLANEKKWVWNSNEKPAKFFKWRPNEPNDLGGEDCVHMTTDGMWNDFPCESPLKYICETDAFW